MTSSLIAPAASPPSPPRKEKMHIGDRKREAWNMKRAQKFKNSERNGYGNGDEDGDGNGDKNKMRPQNNQWERKSIIQQSQSQTPVVITTSITSTISMFASTPNKSLLYHTSSPLSPVCIIISISIFQKKKSLNQNPPPFPYLILFKQNPNPKNSFRPRFLPL